MTRTLVVALLVTLVSSTSMGAQAGPPVGPPPDGRARGGMSRGGMRGDPRMTPEMRLQMERRLQDRIDQIVRQRLVLTDDQFGKMREVASRFEADRRELRNEEMSTRFAMRKELFAGEKADEKRVGELLDQMTRFERRRLELQEREQRELARFLSATQRARYIGLQDELRRSMQDVQRRRMDPDSAASPDGRPGLRRVPRPPGGR
ncbi:MAG: hypothetical protein ABMA00_06485 [Gemmatimonas sp.]